MFESTISAYVIANALFNPFLKLLLNLILIFYINRTRIHF